VNGLGQKKKEKKTCSASSTRLSTKEEKKINVDSIEMKNDEKERSYIQMTLIQS